MGIGQPLGLPCDGLRQAWRRPATNWNSQRGGLPSVSTGSSRQNGSLSPPPSWHPSLVKLQCALANASLVAVFHLPDSSSRCPQGRAAGPPHCRRPLPCGRGRVGSERAGRHAAHEYNPRRRKDLCAPRPLAPSQELPRRFPPHAAPDRRGRPGQSHRGENGRESGRQGLNGGLALRLDRPVGCHRIRATDRKRRYSQPLCRRCGWESPT